MPTADQTPKNAEEEDLALEHIHYHCIEHTVKRTHHAPRDAFDKDRWGKLVDERLRQYGNPPRSQLWQYIRRIQQIEGRTNAPSDQSVQQDSNDEDTFQSMNIHPFSQLDIRKGSVMGGLQRFSNAVGAVASNHHNAGGRPTSMPMPASIVMPKGFAPI